MTKEKTARQLKEQIDKDKVKTAGKKKSHHLTQITARGPIEYVVCTDGTEIAYTKSEEKMLMAAYEREYRAMRGKNVSKE
jgi:hypothetical protein